ncbi:TPM domain-containing protein [Candidatus Woesearchaeota archaeon]|nr:TPM domain-containing protein [Candidatus Woesearchaeota archaeon]
MKKLFLIIAVILMTAQFAVAQIPAISSYVTDNAGILASAAKLNLENELRDLEKQTNGVQFAIYIENEYPKEYSLEEYTLKIAEKNRIGKKGNDNGVLLYVAVNDKAYRWETGYGVEGTLNAALLGRISRDYLVPNFRNGDYEAGILKAADVVKRLLLNSNDPDIVALKNENNMKTDNLSIIFGILLIIFIFFVLFVAFNKAKKLSKSSKYKKTTDSFYRGAAGGIFSGGFGRGGAGGFGGFSGGGGGFGGGGHSGGW